MSISIAYTDRGVLLGDFTEELDGGWTVENPVFVNITQNGATLVPFLGLVEENKIFLSRDVVNFGNLFTPAIELRNSYSSQFGSGIQLV